MTNWTYSPRRDLISKVKRRYIQWRAAAPAALAPSKPVVTITFDDFPRSAVTGADIVESFGGRAGYFACTDFVGKSGPYGEMFVQSDIEDLQARGHEIGAHTHSHMNCEIASPGEVVEDMNLNIQKLRDMGLTSPVSSMAYPYGETSLMAKKKLSSDFAVGRGVLAGLNLGNVDLMQLRAFELDGASSSVSNAHAAIEAAEKSNAWVIIFTHDVHTSPTSFGTTPKVLKDLCKHAQDIGAELMAPTRAATEVGAVAA